MFPRPDFISAPAGLQPAVRWAIVVGAAKKVSNIHTRHTRVFFCRSGFLHNNTQLDGNHELLWHNQYAMPQTHQPEPATDRIFTESNPTSILPKCASRTTSPQELLSQWPQRALNSLINLGKSSACWARPPTALQAPAAS